MQAESAEYWDSPGSKVTQVLNLVKAKVTGERYSPSLFRVGMTLTLDPAPFVLAGAATKVTPPGGASRI